MKFREHRGSLQDSMATAVELEDTFEALVVHLTSLSMGDTPLFPVSDVATETRIKHMGVDLRGNWGHTWLVRIEGWGVVGMVNALPTGTPDGCLLPATDVALTELATANEFQAKGHVLSKTLHYFDIGHAEQGILNSDAKVTSVSDVNLHAGAIFDLNPGDVQNMRKAYDATVGVSEHGHILSPIVHDLEPEQVVIAPDETVSSTEWFKKLRDLVANEDNDEALHYLDSLTMAIHIANPPVTDAPGQGAQAFAKLEDWVTDLGHPDFEAFVKGIPEHITAQWKQADAGMVIVPDAEHMTEAMVDASRGLHLYYIEAGSGVTCEHMRKHLGRYAPWAAKHYPQWFRDDGGHLTKAGRAQIAHALTVGAYFDPDAREEYFAEAREQKGRIWDNPFHQRVRITFKPLVMGELFEDGGFVVHKRFMEANKVGENQFLITLNRSDLPKEHRKKFKQTAVAVFMTLQNEGREVVFGELLVYPKTESSTFQVTPTMASRY